MNGEVIADLKGFIAATVSQAMADVATKADIERLDAKIGAVDSKIDGVEQRLTKRLDEIDMNVKTIADAHAEQLEDHERRLGRLEHHHAA